MSQSNPPGSGRSSGPPSKSPQTITFSAPTTPLTYATGTKFSVTATADSGLPVSIASDNPAVISISGKKAVVTGAGTATITASQAGNAHFDSAANVAHTVTVYQASQVLTAIGLATKYVGDAPFGVTASSSAALTAFTLASSDSSVATVSGMTVTPVAPGMTTITVHQAGNSFYLAAEWEGLLTVKDAIDDDADGEHDPQDDIDTDLTDGEVTQAGDVDVVASDVAGQKHLRLEVPHYDSETSTATAPSSYIHLGGRRTDHDGKAPGDDLLERIGLTTSTESFYLDDYRYANSQQHGNTVYHRKDGIDAKPTRPQAMTGQLITRGGWREHTDGNRITTTRGDRVEVIGGNYKMVVLGRVWSDTSDHGFCPSYWESSGGHNKDGTNTPGEVTSIVWKEAETRENDSYEATWKVYDETIKGKVISRYTGNQYEWNTCDLIVDTIGSADSVGLEDDGCPEISSADVAAAQQQEEPEDGWVMSVDPARKKINPEITETTTATEIYDEIHANQSISAKVEDTEVIRTSKTETTTITGSLTTQKFAGIISDQKGMVGSETQPGDGSMSYTNVKTFKENVIAGEDPSDGLGSQLVLGEFGGLKLEVAVGGMHWTNSGSGFALNTGVVAGLTIGLDTSLFVVATTIGMNLGATNEVEMTAAVGAQLGVEATYRMKYTKAVLSKSQVKLVDLLQKGDSKVLSAVKKSPKMFTCFL